MFFMNFRWLDLETQTELEKKFVHFKYLLLEIRRFPGSFAPEPHIIAEKETIP